MSALPVPALLLLFLLPTGSILRHAMAHAPARQQPGARRQAPGAGGT
eukprot:COSAG06_NODE_41275_length_393_cov_0.693878_1_plen_46_part_10